MFGTRWIASAAHAGSGAILLWVGAALCFAVPSAFAVGRLASKYPGAGGMYLWTRNDYGPWHGFLCFWIYWMGIACWFPGAAMFYMSSGAYGLPREYVWLADSRVFVVGTSVAAVWIALGTNLIGLRVGKWTQNTGGISSWLLTALLTGCAVFVWMKRGSATQLRLLPPLDWETISLWSTIAYAMTGLELIGMMSAEIRRPERIVVPASVLASVLVAAFYIASTAAMLVLLRPENISEMSGLAQAGRAVASEFDHAWITPAIAVLILLSAIGQFGGLGTAVSRMPFAAGVDHLLPPAFARVHPRWSTPHVAIVCLGAIATVLLVIMQAGDTMRAAYRTIVSLMVIAGFLPYLYLFGSAWKAGCRVSAVTGATVSVLAIACALIPGGEVTNVWLFEAKLAAGTALVIGSAWLVFRRRGQWGGA
jgi:APA family basic amino acid/polyamine antiporter